MLVGSLFYLVLLLILFSMLTSWVLCLNIKLLRDLECYVSRMIFYLWMKCVIHKFIIIRNSDFLDIRY